MSKLSKRKIELKGIEAQILAKEEYQKLRDEVIQLRQKDKSYSWFIDRQNDRINELLGIIKEMGKGKVAKSDLKIIK